MSPDEIVQAVVQGNLSDFEGLSLGGVEIRDDVLIVDGYAALEVGTISSALDKGTDLLVNDTNNTALATLCFTKHLGEIERTSLTRYQFVAFLADAELADCDRATYVFKSNYLIVEEARLAEYLAGYRASAPIWGSFSHPEVPSLNAPRTVPYLIARPGLKMPTAFHGEVFGRYVNAANPLERYLRLYQSVELLFDYVIFKRMKALGDDLAGFTGLLSEHGQNETQRLKAIMNKYCSDHLSVAAALAQSSGYPIEREEIFQIHSKSTNPLDQNKWVSVTTAMDGAAFTDCEMHHLRVIPNVNAFRNFVLDVAVYWIYRVRSSIAHNRVGEFLLQDRHAAFVSNFAEPLMLETVCQIFANPDFKGL